MTNELPCPWCGATIPPGAAGGLCPKCVAQLTLGTQVRYFGDYELLEEIGRGGMGVVYKARQKSLNRLVAVKLLLSGSFASEEAIKRFHVEAEAAANLQHPNIVALHEVGVHDGLHYFSMDYVAGPDLARVVGDQPLAPGRAARYLQLIAEAVHYAHQRGILHRDLKPSNVLIDPLDQPRITDFGLAKRLTSTSDFGLRTSDLTLSGQVLGAPSYIAPEQAAGKRSQVGVPSDVYGLGALLYHLLCGRPPFVGDDAAATLVQVQTTEPPLPRQLNPAVPRDLEAICLKCLAKDPERRYATAAALAEDLRHWQAGEPIQARPASRAEAAGRWLRQRPLARGLAAAAGLLLLAGLLGETWWVLAHRKASPPSAELPRILTHPASQTVPVGAEVVFTVRVISPTRAGFEWQFNGSNLPGAANNTAFSLPHVKPSDAGLYRVVVTNAAGRVTSLAARLTVLNTTPEDLLMPRAPVLAHGRLSGATVNLAAILKDPALAAEPVANFALWRKPLSAFNSHPTMPQLRVDPFPETVLLSFALSAAGEFYLGAEGPVPDVLCTIGTFYWGSLPEQGLWDGWASPTHWGGHGAAVSDNGVYEPPDIGLVGLGWKEFLDLQAKGHLSDISPYDSQFRGTSAIRVKHKLPKPVWVVYYPVVVARGDEFRDYGVGLPLNDKWCQFASIFDNGSAQRAVRVQYQGALGSFVACTVHNNSRERSWLRLDGRELLDQTNWGFQGRKLFNQYPARVELGGTKSWACIAPAVTLTVAGDAVEVLDWTENPSLGSRRNPKPDVLVLATNTWSGPRPRLRWRSRARQSGRGRRRRRAHGPPSLPERDRSPVAATPAHGPGPSWPPASTNLEISPLACRLLWRATLEAAGPMRPSASQETVVPRAESTTNNKAPKPRGRRKV